MRVSSGGRAQHGQRDDQDRLDDMALWSSTHEAPTFIMNSFTTFHREQPCLRVWAEPHGNPLFGADARERAAGLCVTAVCRRSRSSLARSRATDDPERDAGARGGDGGLGDL